MSYFLFLQDNDDNDNDYIDAGLTPEVSNNPEFVVSSDDDAVDDDNGDGQPDDDEMKPKFMGMLMMRKRWE